MPAARGNGCQDPPQKGGIFHLPALPVPPVGRINRKPAGKISGKWSLQVSCRSSKSRVWKERVCSWRKTDPIQSSTWLSKTQVLTKALKEAALSCQHARAFLSDLISWHLSSCSLRSSHTPFFTTLQTHQASGSPSYEASTCSFCCLE